METYFKFKMFMEYALPIALLIIVIIFIAICTTVSIIKANKIEKFFIKHGYKRELFGVPSFGNGAFYGWVRESDNKRVDDRDIRGWSLKQIKEKYQ